MKAISLGMTLLSVIRFARDRAGQDLIDYALIAGLLALVVGAILPSVASIIVTIFNHISSAILTRVSSWRQELKPRQRLSASLLFSVAPLSNLSLCPS